jgi:hypothetical protein
MSSADANGRERGFVLTDALVGLFVLAAASASFASAFGLAGRQAQLANTSASALLIAKQCIEDRAGESGAAIRVVDGRQYNQRRSKTDRPPDERGRVVLRDTLCVVSWISNQTGVREVRLERVDVVQKEG